MLSTNMQNSPVDVVSTDTVKLNLSRWIQRRRDIQIRIYRCRGAIPKEYIPAVGEGIEEAAQAGILGGFPVLGVHANVYDGSYHEVDSSEMAFHIAGSMAFKEAMAKASPVLLEPIMKVEVTMPEEYMGDVIGDINSRRGRIEGMDDIGGRLLRCSDILQTYVLRHRDVVTTLCSSRNMSQYQNLFRKKFLQINPNKF